MTFLPVHSTALLQRLPPHLLQVLRVATQLAHTQQIPLWLVGGVVRDLLLQRKLDYDLDLVIEGDAVALAHDLASALHGKVVATHRPFGTATVIIAHPQRQGYDSPTPKPPMMVTIDIAMARTESYPAPAALPIVQPATITQDLFRRDFALNALALEIRSTSDGNVRVGRVLDNFNGLQDIQAGVVRVLHDNSFRDDPTRILRGLRLAARLKFTFAPHTIVLMRQALDEHMLEITSAERIQHELCLALQEPAPDTVLHLADTLGITPHLVDGLHWYPKLAAACARVVNQQISHPDLVYTGILTYNLTLQQREACITRYRLPNNIAYLLRDVATLQNHKERLIAANMSNSELDHLLHPFDDVALAVVCYMEPAAAPVIRHYQSELRMLKPALNGHALQEMGVVAGPVLGQMLRQLRTARLDGHITSEAEERAWVVVHRDQPYGMDNNDKDTMK